VKLPQGGIKRLSASILLDQTVKWEKKGNNLEKTFVPPSAESLRAIKDIVSASIGFVSSRGDQLVVESLPFETTLNTPPPESAVPQSAPPATGLPNWLPQVGLDPRLIGGIAGGLILLVGVAGYLLRKRRKRKKTVTTTPALPRGNAAQEIGSPETPAQLTAAGLSAKVEALGVAQTARIEQLLGVVRTHIHDDPALAANVLRTWMEEKRS
jgi:flagellar M-ring protein FliF